MAATAFKNPIYEDDSNVTFTASGAIAAGAYVEVLTGTMVVGQAAAASVKIIGVSKETVATGDLVTVDCLGEIWTVTAKGAVAAGDPIGAVSDGSGAVSTITVAAFGDVRKVRGIALQAISDGQTGKVMVGV